ncbi:MAG: RsmE family RNA methyltransferase [bacterium]|jgi:16S rRNA (uracil1498-N3)-methyltransferase|nr:RsmE family RNA methyltransferase [bacterium]
MKRTTRLVLPALPREGGWVDLDDGKSHHLLRVLRLAEGQDLEVLDGAGGLATAQLTVDGRRVRLHCQPPWSLPHPSPRLEAWMPLIRPERLETAVEKLTELGVARILVYSSERTGNQRRPPELARLWRLMDAALEQSGNPWRPELTAVVPLAGLLAQVEPPLLVAGRDHAVAGPFPERLPGRLALLAGPEGGFSPDEELLLAGRVLGRISLGQHVLRAETAMIALAAAVQARASIHEKS